MRKKGFISVIVLLVLILGVLAGCGTNADNVAAGKKEFIVGSASYTERFIMGELLATLVEENMPDVKVVRKLGLNGTMVVHSAITNGDIDAAVEYTGSGLMQILHKDLITDPDEAYSVVKENYHKNWGIKWLEPLGFNNTYAMAVKKDYADANGLEKASDLIKVAPDAVLGCSMEFSERPDGYPGWSKEYGIKFKEVMPMDPGLMYSSIKNDEVDVISAFSTDGRIPAFDLVILEDDRRFFPPYYAVPMVREDTLSEIPGLEDLINKLAGKIDDAKMAELNAKVDIDGMDPHEVAKEFLQTEGLI
ncbi:glycine betaine ABC transporter substrate-binding protein [Calorimonas adulescens]|uniref:Glycine/betaine ABC transporter substrate-binding protein n=1 Tax=Calorimonas adulescens TaxID=2606906 RepID=A0A5D8QBK6_9THEO|nr:glycine betaine ABC transporter substrate-binding protein [Calorimonas adulescens]TZE80913.1 glycine/betaine ABC transporter substrate-binding protein [Calorimonas adulescens]